MELHCSFSSEQFVKSGFLCYLPVSFHKICKCFIFQVLYVPAKLDETRKRIKNLALA